MLAEYILNNNHIYFQFWVAVLHAIWFPALHGRLALLPTVVNNAHIFQPPGIMP
jgi:hypothetical protein